MNILYFLIVIKYFKILFPLKINVYYMNVIKLWSIFVVQI